MTLANKFCARSFLACATLKAHSPPVIFRPRADWNGYYQQRIACAGVAAFRLFTEGSPPRFDRFRHD
jgi:hypothetical protein